MNRDWSILPLWPGRDEAAIKLGVSPIVAQVLYNRGIRDIDEARLFLAPKLNGLIEPEEYDDLTVAAETIARAIREKRRIVVYSDYDVDGICGAAIMWHLITRAGGNIEVYIPHRLEEGYGVNIDAVNSLADRGFELLITVDCGIRDHEAVDQAMKRGMEVIVTDHHEPGPDFPRASAIVHPLRRSASGTGCNSVNPCGAAVAFKLSWAVAKILSGSTRVRDELRDHLVELTALVALATIADVVPLLGENRILAKFGLEQLSRSKLVGLQALLRSARLVGSRVESYHVGFVLGPRLNAAGRMGHAREALELLTGADCRRADELADHLNHQNRRRRQLEETISREAAELAESQGQLADDIPILVLARKEWHVGIIGIVASKLVDRFNRPVVMIGLDGERGQGSARSVEGYDINQALDACRAYLLGYGGHAMAAGLQIESKKIAGFIQAMQQHAGKHFCGELHRPVLKIDAQIEPDMLTGDLLNQLHKLAPFGQGNPRPIFASGVTELIGEPKIVGSSGNHLSFSVRWGVRNFRAIAFNQADAHDRLRDARRNYLAFEPVVDEFSGPGVIQLRVKSIKPVA